MADYLFLHVDNIHQHRAHENTHIIYINKHVGGGSDDHFTAVTTFLFGDSVCESAHIQHNTSLSMKDRTRQAFSYRVRVI